MTHEQILELWLAHERARRALKSAARNMTDEEWARLEIQGLRILIRERGGPDATLSALDQAQKKLD